jgi:hypothetical protein
MKLIIKELSAGIVTGFHDANFLETLTAAIFSILIRERRSTDVLTLLMQLLVLTLSVMILRLIPDMNTSADSPVQMLKMQVRAGYNCFLLQHCA